MKKYRLLLLAVPALALGGCYMENREAFRPEPVRPDVMADLQDTADTHPLEGWSR